MSSERKILASLHLAVLAPLAATYLECVAQDVGSVLKNDPAARLAWRTIPLNIYGELPAGIASSWVFVLRAGCTSGAERHPNSIQRVMSLCGHADMQTWNGERWTSNVLRSKADLRLEERWLSIPRNVWHRPVMGDVDWVVVSFHTASSDELIEELPLDEQQPDGGSREAKAYAGRERR